MRRIALMMLFLSIAVFVFAGDIAQFVNLGFSEDSKTFLFGIYGIEAGSSQAYAELYLVDVDKNVFYPAGVQKKVYTEKIVPGQDGLGALMNLLHENRAWIERYKMNHLLTGRLVYILLNGQEAKSQLQFRDFIHGNSFDVKLIQKQFQEPLSAQFHIELNVQNSKHDNDKTFTIGLPNFKRPDVKSYRIRQVFFSPDETRLVFVVEMTVKGQHGNNIRYMVETVKIQ